MCTIRAGEKAVSQVIQFTAYGFNIPGRSFPLKTSDSSLRYTGSFLPSSLMKTFRVYKFDNGGVEKVKVNAL